MKGKKKVKEPAGMNIPEIFAALARTWRTSLWTWTRSTSG